MRILFFLFIAAFVTACSTSNKGTGATTANTLTGKEQNDGWQLLFNGSSTAGWHTYGKSGIGSAWKVDGDALRLDASAKKNSGATGGDIVTDNEYADFHLKYDWKIAPNGNSGVMFYVQETPQFPFPWSTGPEMQVLDNNGHPDAKIIKHRAGDLYDLISVSKETVRPVDQWNEAEIISEKGTLQFRLNGETVVRTTLWDDAWRNMIANSKFKSMQGFGTFKSGRISLQDHGDDVWFRNIKIRRL